jgi:drug/metabolite transporter (DMT)-like permease
MPRVRVLLVVSLSMLAFAANSLLCRLALRGGRIDPAGFTAIRLLAGALSLALVMGLRRTGGQGAASWRSGAVLFIYAAAFSFAYVELSAGAGVLVLFGAVQATMIGWALWRGERPRTWQAIGYATALAGLVVLLLPGATTPAPLPTLVMALSGLAWGIYSIRGAAAGDPTATTAGNFRWSLVPTIILTLVAPPVWPIDPLGAALAAGSGAITSGLGYIVWYATMKELSVAQAAVAQVAVPVLVALGGVAFLGEPASLRLVVAALMILGGIIVAISARQRRA